MLGAETHPTAVAGPDDERTGQLTIRHVPELRHFICDVVEAYGEEVREHDFGDRAQSRHRGANRRAEDRLFGDGRIAHSPWTKLFVEAYSRLEHAARPGNVFAQEDDALVALHLLGDAA